MADGTALPENIKAILHAESSAAHTQHMTSLKANKAISNFIVRASAAKQYDEPGPAQARSIDKILRMPT